MLKLLNKVPRGFADAFAKINAAIKVVNALAAMEGKGGIKITKSESNYIIEYNPAEVGSDGLSGGLPAGYEETLITICDSGTPTDVYALIKPSA